MTEWIPIIHSNNRPFPLNFEGNFIISTWDNSALRIDYIHCDMTDVASVSSYMVPVSIEADGRR